MFYHAWHLLIFFIPILAISTHPNTHTGSSRPSQSPSMIRHGVWSTLTILTTPHKTYPNLDSAVPFEVETCKSISSSRDHLGQCLASRLSAAEAAGVRIEWHCTRSVWRLTCEPSIHRASRLIWVMVVGRYCSLFPTTSSTVSSSSCPISSGISIRSFSLRERTCSVRHFPTCRNWNTTRWQVILQTMCTCLLSGEAQWCDSYQDSTSPGSSCQTESREFSPASCQRVAIQSHKRDCISSWWKLLWMSIRTVHSTFQWSQEVPWFD